MITHLDSDFDVTDTYSKLGELAENPPELVDLGDAAEDVEAFARWNEEVDCGDLDLDLECQGARLA
jgi:hypothetical protein